MKSIISSMDSVLEKQQLQEQKLQELVHFVVANSPYYQRIFAENKLEAHQIQTLHDLAKIPVTTKQDLQNYNDDFLCVHRSKIIDFVCTSGTLGKPVNFYLTEKDLQRLAFNEATSLKTTGINTDDVIQLTTTLDKRFMAGMAYFLGIRDIGAGVIRMGSGVPSMQWDAIQSLSPTVLIGVPSFLLKMAEYANNQGVNTLETSINKLICIGESIRNVDFSLNSLGKRLFEKWGLPMFSTYASTEMGAAFTECSAGKGGHQIPELIIVECLDENLNPVPVGQPGELVVTTLGMEGMPLIRFKTGDIAILHYEKCACGNTAPRISPIVGRKQQMLKYKGTTVYPPMIYDALNEIPAIKNYLLEVSTNEIGMDDILISIGCEFPTESFKRFLMEHLKAKLRVTPSIRFIPIEEIYKIQMPSTTRKPVIFHDFRTALGMGFEFTK
jgi:phenylacetate-CoA ligase